MRPIDHVDEPLRAHTGFWFNPPGWRGWILSVTFGALILISGFVQFALPRGWTATLVSGTAIIVVMLVLNELLKRTLRNGTLKR